MLVSTPPGCTELTRMPNWPSSCAAALVIPRTANLLALYADSPAAPVNPSTEEMFTIDPPPAGGHRLDDRLHAEPAAHRVDLQHPPELGQRHVRDRRERQHPRVVHQHIQFAERRSAVLTAAAHSASLVTSWCT